MRGPLLNLSPGLGPSGVDMEYRRNSQGTLFVEASIFLRFLYLSSKKYHRTEYKKHGIR